jgi:hypothetical protein
MKCGHKGCGGSAEIYNLDSDRWECELHHRTIRTAEANRRTRARLRDRVQQENLEKALARLRAANDELE